MNLLAAEQRGIVTLHPPHIEKISTKRSGEFNPKRMNLLAAEQRGIVTLHPPHIEKISPQMSGEFNPKRLKCTRFAQYPMRP